MCSLVVVSVFGPELWRKGGVKSSKRVASHVGLGFCILLDFGLFVDSVLLDTPNTFAIQPV